MSEVDYWKAKWSAGRSESPNSFARRAYRIIKAKKFKTLLDLGCGDGRDSVYFADKGLEVTALDFSESGITKIRVRRSTIKCILGDIRAVNFKANAFDI